MNARIWKAAAALCLAVVAGCSSSKDSGHTPTTGAPAGATLSLSASDVSVIANGTNTVTISVTDTGGSGPIQLTTTRGTFSGGGTTTSLAGATGTVTLVTCNASTLSTCAGTATVTATGPGGETGSVNITFGSLASVCPANCSADPGCAGLACTLTAGGSGSCSATTPSTCTAAPACTKNPANATTETSCSDGIDNDCNGSIDCADSACDGQQCGASPLQQCKASKCTDLSTGLAVTVTPARTRLPANGTATTTIVVSLKSGETAVPNLGVTLSLAPAAFGALSATTATTGADGTVSVTYTAPATAGVAVVTASPTLVPAVKASASITMPRLGSIAIPDPYAIHPVMGVKTSGWNEFGGVLVQVLDDQGQPYPDGQAVRFEHQVLGGSTFGPPLATTNLGTCTAASGCVAYDAVTASPVDKPDSEGMATVPLFSGTVAGTLVVAAKTTAGGATSMVTLPGVAVVGAKASATNFSIQCSPRNVPALAETDCSTSWVDAPFTCVALLKDRFGNLLGTPTQVIFVSEAGAIGQVAWTPAYDPASQGSGQKNLGTATQIFQTLGAGLPFDVTPQTVAGVTEPAVIHALDGCGTRTHNPRDGVVTIIAIADGEEGFYDANGNGRYDASTATATGEPFIDQGEPFVDQNDDGVWNPGEWFLDVNGNGVYDGPSGKWDAQTKIWTETVVVYTGAAARATDMIPSLVPPAPAGTYVGTRWIAGASWAGACAPNATPTFAVNAKLAGPPAVPATSQSFVVVASDYNLNFLDTGSSYSVTVANGANVKASYGGLSSYADDLGMDFRYWPCDQPTSGSPTCASQCRAVVPTTGGTGGTGPCLMKPQVSGFSCGLAATTIVTGGDQPDPGIDEIDWNVKTPWNVYLGAKTFNAVQPIYGTNN